jgi:hypothetical protein
MKCHRFGVAAMLCCLLGNSYAQTPQPTNGGDGKAHGAGALAEQVIDFDRDTLGAPPSQFETVIGDWSVAETGGARGLQVDGTKWRQGVPSANLADQAKRLYGDRYVEFLDGVKAFAFFPLSVFRGDCGGDSVTFSVRFYPQNGRIDQAAGIVWSLAPEGSYVGVRANALEHNLLFFKVARGKRTVLQTVRGVVTDSKKWHTLRVTLQGKSLTTWVDEKEVLRRGLDSPASGRCGLWSKADSQVLFDDFRIAKQLPSGGK